ncbi:MAG: hypothetical protein ACK4RK_01500 [Gemmataceae bacterium]
MQDIWHILNLDSPPEGWEWLRRLDLTHLAGAALEMLGSADPCFLGLIIFLLGFLGVKVTAGRPAFFWWGVRLGLVAFLTHGSYQLYAATGWDAIAWPRVAIRSALVGGVVVALTWIVLPIVAFAYGHLRLAVAAFLAYGGYALITAPDWQPEQVSDLAGRALVAAGLVMVAAWIVQPFTDSVRAWLARSSPAAPSQDDEAARRQRRERRKLARWRRLARRQLPREPAADAEEEIISHLQIETRRRRDRVRMKVELQYALAAPEIGNRLTHGMFEAFINRYLGDHLSPDEVEENARLLESLLQSQNRQLAVFPECRNLEDLTRWYLDEQKRLQEMNLDPQLRQSRMQTLHHLYLERANQLLPNETAG